MKMGKNAQVGVVAVVLIILISLILLLIVWNVVVPLIREKSGEVETGQLTVSVKIEEAVLFATGSLKVSVERGTGKGDIDSLKFVFYNANGASHVESKEEDLPGQLEKKVYHFSPIPDFGKVERVSVIPVVGKAGGFESESEIEDVLEIPSGLVSWWRFDDSQDFVGENHGILSGGVDFIDDLERGEVASFDNGYINFGNDDSLDIEDKFAISVWVRGENGVIIKKGNLNYEISLDKGRVVFSYVDGGLNSIESIFEIGGGWHHIAVTEDWTGNQNLMIYIDGKLDNRIEMREIPEMNDDSVLVGENFNGYIDELMFFDESLSYVQVNSLFENQRV